MNSQGSGYLGCANYSEPTYRLGQAQKLVAVRESLQNARRLQVLEIIVILPSHLKRGHFNRKMLASKQDFIF